MATLWVGGKTLFCFRMLKKTSNPKAFHCPSSRTKALPSQSYYINLHKSQKLTFSQNLHQFASSNACHLCDPSACTSIWSSIKSDVPVQSEPKVAKGRKEIELIHPPEPPEKPKTPLQRYADIHGEEVRSSLPETDRTGEKGR